MAPRGWRETSPFVANRGQWPAAARFAWQRGETTLAVDARGWTWTAITPHSDGDAIADDTRAVPGVAVRFDFASPEGAATVRGEQPWAAARTYLRGDDPAAWCRAPMYDAVRLAEILPGVDVVVYELDGHPEYDVVLDRGAALADVEIAVTGGTLALADDGTLWLHTALGALHQPPPLTWQWTRDGHRQPVDCRYELRGPDRFGFCVVDRDPDLRLCIDPGILWSTVLPGANGAGGPSEAIDIAVDDTGVVTVAGITREPLFPTVAGAFSTQLNGFADVFVARLDPAASGNAQLLQSTFIGGGNGERPIELRPAGGLGVVVVGQTGSTDFPTSANAFDPSHNGTGDGYLIHLDLAQSGAAQLLYSTYIGGAAGDFASAVALQADGSYSIAGDTASANLPTTANAFDRTFNGGTPQFPFDSFCWILDPTMPPAQQLRYATFVGGTSWDATIAIHVDAAGIHTLAGETASPDFPVGTAGLDPTFNGVGDAYLLRLDPAQSGPAQVTWGTFFGAGGSDWFDALHVADDGVITAGGDTNSPTFPTTPNAFNQSRPGGPLDCFVARFDPTRTGAAQLLYATLIGGGENDNLRAMQVDGAGLITLAGDSRSLDWPTSSGAFATARFGGTDAVLAWLDPARAGAAQLLYSTYLGGDGNGTSSGEEEVAALALHPGGGVLVAGNTESDDYPTSAGSFAQRGIGGARDAFVTHLDLLPTGVAAFGQHTPGCGGALHAAAISAPAVGNAGFSLLCTGAPASSIGVLGLGTAASSPLPIAGVDVWIDLLQPFVLTNIASDPRGASAVALPIPAQPTLVGSTVSAQFVFFGPQAPPPCPVTGFSASQGLSVTLQP